MPREIKFRAWIPKNKAFMTGDKIALWLWNDGHLSVPYDWALQQYTGLKDKNGEEIYEGDLLSTPFGNYDPTSRSKAPIIGVVEFDLERQSYQMRLGDRPTGKAAVALNMGAPFTGFYSRRAEVSEIIGNIYENAELLHA